MAAVGTGARWATPVVVLLALMVVGGRLAPAAPDATYRPTLPPPPFAGRCNPLPGVELDLAYQLRADRTLATPAGPVRRLTLHYDLLSADAAREQVRRSLLAGGFTAAPAPDGADLAVGDWYRRPGYGDVGVGVAAFDVPPDSIVRGRLLLDVPTGTLTDAVRRVCDDPVQTKRFPPDTEDKQVTSAG